MCFGSTTAVIAILFSYITLAQLAVVRPVSSWLNSRIKITSDNLAKDCLDRKAVQDFEISERIREELGFLTIIIGTIELATFAIVTDFILLNKMPDVYETVSQIVLFFAGWMTIKTIGSWGQWSDSRFGRAVFYVFLLCTFLNITLGIALGVLCTKFFSCLTFLSACL